MIKSKKIVAVMIATLMLMSNFVGLLTNISIAAKTDVTVVFTADEDDRLTLESDGKTLTYNRAEDRRFSFNLKRDGESISFVEGTTEIEGKTVKTYTATGISSNENLHITSSNINLGEMCIKFEGESIGMWNDNPLFNGDFASQSLDFLKDSNHYQFRFEKIETSSNPGDPGNPPPTMCNVDFGTATWTIEGETVTASMEGKTINNGAIDISNNDRITLTGYNPMTMEPVIRVKEDGYTARLLVDENNQTWVSNTSFSIPWELHLEFIIQERTGLDEDDQNQRPAPNATATINLSSDAEYKDSFQNAVIEINGYPINEEVDIGEKLPATNTAHYYYNAEDNGGKIRFTFSTLFIEKYVGTLQINDEVFDVTEDLLDYTNRTDWLNHYGHQMVTLEVNVNKAPDDIYNIRVNTTANEGKDQWIGNFLWTTAEEDKNSDLYIGHSKLEVVKVVYEIDDREVTVEGKELLKDEYLEYDPYGETKSLVVPEGAKCTMRITPEYGYQVTSFGINGFAIETGEEISEFTFPIHKGNFHLGAEVTKVDDKVDAKSKKVQSGNIEIGNNEIDSGSVILTVNDIELDENKLAEFKEKAGDYTINSYLDIDLDKVVYKGTESDVWSERIHELKGEATIQLKLEDGVDGNNIIIVHNINDGDEYEIIEIESYDPETNIITFKTKSFSNYAIASKTDVTAEETTDGTKTNNPKTGDNIMIYMIVFAVATISLVTIVKASNKKVRRH